MTKHKKAAIEKDFLKKIDTWKNFSVMDKNRTNVAMRFLGIESIIVIEKEESNYKRA